MIVLEDLNVQGMVKRGHLACALSDVGMRVPAADDLQIGMGWERLLIAPRFYASSKRCSACHHLKETLLLSEWHDVCEACGLIQDRDLNAACNLAVGYREFRGRYACGES